MKRSFTSRRDGDGPSEGPDAPTARRILAAALRVLARDGFGALSARAIAAEAGTNLALLNYYFGSKEQLLLALFHHLDAERLDRQRRMYEAPEEPLSAKWRRAVAYYRQDLADGYVRVLQELTAHGYSSPVIAVRVRQRLNGWRSLLEEVAATHLPPLGISAPPAWVASAIISFWLGMESQHLAGATEAEGHFFEILDAVGDWLERLERERGPALGQDGAVGPTAAPDGGVSERGRPT